jgi:hypothetical protein
MGAGVFASSAAETSSVSFPLDPSALVLSLGGGSSKIFHFDAVLKDSCHQEACYDEARAAGASRAIHAPKTNMTFRAGMCSLGAAPFGTNQFVYGFSVVFLTWSSQLQA